MLMKTCAFKVDGANFEAERCIPLTLQVDTVKIRNTRRKPNDSRDKNILVQLR